MSKEDSRRVGSALLVAKTKNTKICSARGKGHVSTTYVSIQASCPTTCQLRKEKSCYAMNGKVFMAARSLDGHTDDPNVAATDEATCIEHAFDGKEVPQDGVKGGRDLRLHTSGDCRTNFAAGRVGAAASHWKARKGGQVWTYTHAWRHVSRHSWGPDVSVLASLDDASHAPQARAKGYAPTRVVASFPSGKAPWTEHGITWIPCIAQLSKKTGCADCRLCLNADKLCGRNQGIAFEAHGARASIAKRRLTVV